jgi:inorganic triphosphatase YgiF
VTLVLDETSIRTESSIIDSLWAEFALVSGDAGSILFVAEALFAEVGFRFGIENVAARAIRLIRHEEESAYLPEKSVAEPLLPGQISTEAFASVCRSATRQILHNWQIVLESSDPEGPHQMRIGLRRLRTALRVFRPAFDSKALRQLGRELRDIAQLAGEVRDLDVLATDIVGPVAIRIILTIWAFNRFDDCCYQGLRVTAHGCSGIWLITGGLPCG